MDKETIINFSEYRLQKAKDTLNTSEFILKELQDYTGANNRSLLRNILCN